LYRCRDGGANAGADGGANAGADGARDGGLRIGGAARMVAPIWGMPP
jgi:hypothetical protein